MTIRIVQTVAKNDGTLAALGSDGALYQQTKDGLGGFLWQPLEGPPARLANLTVRRNSLLVAVAVDGSLWEQRTESVIGGVYNYEWRPLPTIEDGGR